MVLIRAEDEQKYRGKEYTSKDHANDNDKNKSDSNEDKDQKEEDNPLLGFCTLARVVDPRFQNSVLLENGNYQ